jgi:hypothetical protein
MSEPTISSEFARKRLDNRRSSETLSFCCGNFHYVATVSFFPDGSLAEIFLNNDKAGSDSDSAAKDSAVVASIALQYGAPLGIIRRALLRDPQGVAASPLGVALDLCSKQCNF